VPEEQERLLIGAGEMVAADHLAQDLVLVVVVAAAAAAVADQMMRPGLERSTMPRIGSSRVGSDRTFGVAVRHCCSVQQEVLLESYLVAEVDQR
jgi:hypothetical protein